MKHTIILVAALSATPLVAQETREMAAHEHGVSKLQVAIDHQTVEMTFLAPGADIVGFEYEASTDADKDSIDAAIRVLAAPENLVTLPGSAACRLSEVVAQLQTGDAHHDDGDEDDHAHHDDHAHDEDDHADHDDHAHDEDDHADHDDHDDHAHDEEDGHSHDEEDDHADSGHDTGHSEFRARYVFNCEHPDELSSIDLPFFTKFENAREIEAEYVTQAGAGRAEIDRSKPTLEFK